MPPKCLQKTKKFIAYFVTSLVIFAFLWMPFDGLFIANKTVYAQNNQTTSGQYTTGPTQFTSPNGPGIKGYIKALAPAIAQSPQCKAVIRSKIKTLFKNVKGTVAKIVNKKATQKASEKLAEKTAKNSSLSTNDARLHEIGERAAEYAKQQAEDSAAQRENELCLKSIGRRIALMLLQKITLSTVAWIQTGYEGKPFFLQNPGKFFADIGKNEILQFAAEIQVVNPYGKAYLQNLVTAYNTHFQETARYSLNELIKQTTPQYDGAGFSVDFSAGGWNAWDALTSVPANNPLGAQLLFSNELGKRLEGTSKSTATKYQESLDQAQGFLGQEVCADPDEGITRAQHNAALEAGVITYTQKLVKDPVTGLNKVVNDQPTDYIKGTCKRWEYVTPGHAIAKSMDLVIDYPKNGILEADDLNDAIYLLLDSVIAQATGKLQDGFVNVTNEGADGSFILNYYNADGNYEISQVEKDFAPSQLNSRWLEENPDFNIRTDITQALIDEQRIYSQKLEEQNLEIPGLIMDIRQLDYCIPGPNPNWEETSSIDNFYDNINARVDLKAFDIAGTILDIGLPIAGAALSTVLGGFDPTAILSGVAEAILGDAKEKKVKAMMASYIGDLFQVHIYGAGQDDGQDKNGFGDKDHQDQILDEGDIRSVIENTWSSYADNIYKIYFNGAKSLANQVGAMPFVTNEARNEFAKIEGYQKMAEDNYDAIQDKKSLISRLSDIKDDVETLNATVTDQDSQEYIDGLTPIIAEFSRLSNDMVSGNDIADVDNVLKEIQDERNYVWDDLLKGPGGCEKELEKFFLKENNGSYDLDLNNRNNNYARFVQREAYPLPVYYFYGTVDPYDQVGWASQHALAGIDTASQEPWNSRLLKEPKYIAPTEGFLYGMVYYNRHSGPDGPSVTPAPDPEGDLDGDGKINGSEDELDVDGDGVLDDQPLLPDFPKGDGKITDINNDGAFNCPPPSTPPKKYPQNDPPPPPADPAPNATCDDDPDPYNVDVPWKWVGTGLAKIPVPNGLEGSQWVDGNDNLVQIGSRLDLCPQYIQFPDDLPENDNGNDADGEGAYVEISLPSGTDQNGVPIDIGGLEPRGFGKPDHEGGPQHANNNGKDYRNVCGVIPRAFEKEFQIY